jgi:hypothetical protein
MVTTNNGSPLTPYELACVCKRLVGYQWDTKKIAQRIGVSTTYVDQLLTLMAAPVELLALVHDGKLAAGTAYSLFKAHGGNALSVALGAVEKAEQSGRKKATARDTLRGQYKKALGRKAQVMYETLCSLREDIKKINPETWATVEAVLKEIDGIADQLESIDEEDSND